MASNPLPPNFGADLARSIRESVASGLAAGGIGMPARPRPRPAREGTAPPTPATPTPEEQAKRARGALNLLRHETPETRDMTHEQLQRLVMLQKVKVQKYKLEQHQQAPATTALVPESSMDGNAPGSSPSGGGVGGEDQNTGSTSSTATTREQTSKTICKICMGTEVEFVLECGHLLCGNCIENITTAENHLPYCPVCRTPITDMTKIFW